MKIQDIVEAAGCSERTVRRCADELFPGRLIKGVRTEFTEAEAIALLKRVPKKNMVGQKSEQMSELAAMIKAQSATVEKLCVLVASLIPAQAAKAPAQIEAPSHYTIMGYAAIKHRPIDFTDARKLAYQARGICAERGLEVHKVGDERFGEVNSYPAEVLAEVFA